MHTPPEMLPLREAIDDIDTHRARIEELMEADENDQAHELMERLFLRLVSHLAEPPPFDRDAYVKAALAAGLKRPEPVRIQFAEREYVESTHTLYGEGMQVAGGMAILIATINDVRELPDMAAAWYKIAFEYNPLFVHAQAA